MGTRASLAALAACLLTAGCGGDPIIVLGDLPGTMRIVAGVPDSTGDRVDERATETLLTRPRGVAVGDDGVLYVADYGTRRVLAVTSGGAARLIADYRSCPSPTCPGRFMHAVLDGRGGLLVTEQDANRLWRVDLASGQASVVAGSGDEGTSPDGTPAIAADLPRPWGVAVGEDGAIYFSERGGHRVRTIEADGTLRTVAGSGTAGFGGDGGPAREARLLSPAGLTVHGGRLYIADADNNRVREVDLASGVIRTVAGSGVRVFGGDGGPALDAGLRRPEDVAISPDGRSLFIADAASHRVRRVHLPSGTITTFAGTGETTFNGDMTAAGETALDGPGGLATSAFGLLFIADTGHNLIWRTTVER